MHLKLSFVIIVLYFICTQVQADLDTETNETIYTIEDFKYRTNKIITSVNNNYENLVPEEKFAAHLMKKVTKQISDFLKTEILNGAHNLEEISSTTNFNVCTDTLNFDTVMEMYGSCIENKTYESRQEVALNLNATLAFSNEKISEITKQSTECNLTTNESNCNLELAETMQAAYEEIMTEVNEVNRLILSTYQDVVKEMPSCATEAISHVINMGNIFKCLVMLVKSNP